MKIIFLIKNLIKNMIQKKKILNKQFFKLLTFFIITIILTITFIFFLENKITEKEDLKQQQVF